MGNFLYRIMAKKGAQATVKGIVSILSSASVATVMQAAGIQIDEAKFEAYMTVAIYSGLEMLQNWLKHKKQVKMGGAL